MSLKFAFIEIAFLCFLIPPILQGGVINPCGSKPITVGYNNQNINSYYIFSFFTETNLQDGDYIWIYFPSEYTAIPAGACTSVLMPEDGSIYKTAQSLTCTFVKTSSGNFFNITSVELKASSYSNHTIYIDSVMNPAAGGTGSFKIETRRGNLNLLDYNHNFETVGIVGDPRSIITSSFTRTKSSVNDVADYSFTVTTLSLVPKNGSVVLSFNSGDLTFTSASTCSTTLSSDALCSRTSTSVTFYGFTQDHTTGSYTFTITNIQHPSYAKADGSAIAGLTVRLMNYQTNTILDELSNLAITNLNPGVISSASNKMWYSNFDSYFTFARSYTRSASDWLIYTFTFYTTNALPADGLIDIVFPFDPDECWVSMGLEDVSSSDMVTCTVTAGKVRISGFKAVGANSVIGVSFDWTNPVAGTYTTLQIKTYQSSNKIVDSYIAGSSLVIASHTRMSSLTLISQIGRTTSASYPFLFQLSSVFTEVMTFELNFPIQFSFTTPTCSLVNAASTVTITSCTVSTNKITVSTGGNYASFSSTSANTLTINGVNVPDPGKYPIEFSVKKSSDSTLVYHQTVLNSVNPMVLSSVSVTPVTLDIDRPTIYIFKFTTSDTIPSGAFPYSFSNPTSTIEIDFETTGACANLFRTDLGTGLADGNQIPCYGISNISPASGHNSLTCTLRVPSSVAVGSPAIIYMNDYSEIPKGSDLEIHIPQISNPQCTTGSAHLTISIWKTVSRISTLIYQSSSITLTASCLNIITSNPYNTGTNLNAAPIFVPDTVNSISSIQILYRPASDKYISTANQGSFILKFPPLPSTTPQYYLLDSTMNIECYLHLNIKQVCFIYPEVGWILIYKLTQTIPVNSALSKQDIIYIKNLKNPCYAADMKSYLTIITVDYFQGSDTVSAFREKENVLYQNFAAFSAGSVSNVNVWGSRYEANQPNVEYNWVFVLQNSVLAQGPILLKFPPNYYNLESNPLPRGSVTSNNLEKYDSTQDFFTYQTNVATLANHKGYNAGDLITIKFTGVKNPQSEGLTIDFGVESQMPTVFYSIDLKSDIPGVKIIAANSAGQITYNYFYTSPNNGKLLGNYYINFVLQNSLPAFGTIEITFPANFDSTTSFTKTGSTIECSVSGPITLIETCTVSSLTISVVTRETLTMAAGTSSVTVFLPNIINYSAELDSGPVTIRTIYDNVVLDDSGDSETNRKATTGTEATQLVIGTNILDFVFEPTTEAARAFYNVTIIPRTSFNSTATLQFVFPKIFMRGLGAVSCSSQELQISSLEAMVCTVQDYVLNVTNIKEYNTSINTTGFTISLAGIVNPSKPLVAISDTIAFYIYLNPNYVSDYSYTLGTLSYTAAPPILYMSNYIFGSNNTRLVCDNGFSLTPIITTSFTYITLDYPSIYEIGQMWDYKRYSLSLESSTLSAAQVYQDLILTSYTGTIISGQTFTMNIYQLFNPMATGQSLYPVIYVYDVSSKKIVMKTYNNLNQFDSPNFFDNGLIIILADDVDSIAIEAGTFSDYLNVQFPKTSSSERTIWPILALTSGVNVTSIVCPAGSSNTTFRIGLSRDVGVSSFIIRWSYEEQGYIPIKSLKITVTFYSNSTLQITDNIEVFAGGRSFPVPITIKNAPYADLTVKLYINGYVPSYSSVYPSTIIFNQGETLKEFWISVGKSSTGINGSLVILLSGTNRDSYGMTSRKINFLVSSPDSVGPLMFQRGDLTFGQTWISTYVIMNKPCTIYYAVFDIFTPDIDMGFLAIKNKKVPYDYFGSEYFMGEFIADISTYNYPIYIGGLTPFRDYYLQIFLEDLDGNLGDSPILANVTTNKTFINPIVAMVNIVGVTSMDQNTTTSLMTSLSSLLGIPKTRFEIDSSLFPNMSVELSPTLLYSTSRLLTNATNSSNSSISTTFTIPTATANSFILPILFLPELNDASALNMFQAFGKLRPALNSLLSSFQSSSTLSINYTFGYSGIFSYYGKIYANQWSSQPSIAKIWTNSVDVDNIGLMFTGKVYMIIVPTTIPLFNNTRSNLNNTIRYLAETVTNTTISNSTNTTNTTNATNTTNTTTNTTQNSSNVTESANGWYITYDNTTTTWISINPNKSNISSESCVSLADLCVKCNGSSVQSPKMDRTDIVAYQITRNPQPIQIKNGMDHLNRRAMIFGSMNISKANTGFKAHLELLSPGSSYTLYLIGEDNFTKQPNLMLYEQVVQITFTTPLTDDPTTYLERLNWESLLLGVLILFLFLLKE